MSTFRIRAADGAVELPSGLRLDAASSRRALDPSAGAGSLRVRTGAPPWRHLDFSAGQADGREVLATATFAGPRLMSLELRLRAEATGAPDPGEAARADYSPAAEASIKTLHDRLLVAQLGDPAEGELPAAGATAAAVLAAPLWWRFAWGEVASLHDQRSGNTHVLVRYRQPGAHS